MTKAELINAVQAKMGGDTTHVLAGKAVDAMLDVMAETLKAGGEVALTGIGKLHVKSTNARKGRNPQTGKAIDIPAGKKVAFSVAKALKDGLK